MKKLLALLFAALMLCTLPSCSDKDNDAKASSVEDALFQTPQFEDPPVAEKDTPIIALDAMVKRVNAIKDTKFSFSDELDACTQTVYADDKFEDGEVLTESLSPLGLIPMHLQVVSIADFLPIDSNDFELNDDKTMAYMKESARPASYQGCVLTDFALDLSTSKVVVRAMSVTTEETSSVLLYITSTIQCNDDGAYATTFWSGEYGYDGGLQYVMNTDESLEFTTKDNEVVTGTYNCSQDTSLMETTTNEDGTSNTEYAAERIAISTDIKQSGEHYDIKRTMTMNQSETTHDPNEAEETYKAEQTIQYTDGHYLLTETATMKDESGNNTKSTQYVVFESKTE